MRYVKYIFMFIFCLFIFPLNVHALTSSEYQNRKVCSNYEVAIAKEGKAGDPSSTYADTVGCYGTYNEAVNAMNAMAGYDPQKAGQLLEASGLGPQLFPNMTAEQAQQIFGTGKPQPSQGGILDMLRRKAGLIGGDIQANEL